MKKQYIISGEDISILKQRVPDPCVHTRCSRAQTPGDYGYLGCGREAHCDRRHSYMAFKSLAQANGLWDLAKILFRIDAVKAEQEALQKKIIEDTAKIGGEFGFGNLELISKNLYDGKL